MLSIVLVSKSCEGGTTLLRRRMTALTSEILQRASAKQAHSKKRHPWWFISPKLLSLPNFYRVDDDHYADKAAYRRASGG